MAHLTDLRSPAPQKSAVETAIKEAEEACKDGSTKDCAAAWDVVSSRVCSSPNRLAQRSDDNVMGSIICQSQGRAMQSAWARSSPLSLGHAVTWDSGVPIQPWTPAGSSLATSVLSGLVNAG